MLTGLLLLAVGAAAYNSTQEVVVSSPPVRVRGAGAEFSGPAEEAVVKPMSRAVEEPEVKPMARTSEEPEVKSAVESRGMHGMKKAFKKWMPYMMIPTMMALGYAPFVLSSLKMMVMNALTMNMMALNAAIFLTLRNMAFGPRLGQHVKYHNFGYSNRKKHHPHPPSHHYTPHHDHPPHH